MFEKNNIIFGCAHIGNEYGLEQRKKKIFKNQINIFFKNLYQ